MTASLALRLALLLGDLAQVIQGGQLHRGIRAGENLGPDSRQ
jgi:hypothetical protein